MMSARAAIQTNALKCKSLVHFHEIDHFMFLEKHYTFKQKMAFTR